MPRPALVSMPPPLLLPALPLLLPLPLLHQARLQRLTHWVLCHHCLLQRLPA